MSGLLRTWIDSWRGGFNSQAADLRRVPRPEIGDLIGGVSVALVLIPQSLAYADLAGMPPYIGLFASAFPLIIFALLASSPFLQTGPVALTSLLTFGALTSAGGDPGTQNYVLLGGLLAVIVGVVRLIIGSLRLGSVVYLMAEPVTIGFTSGAGLVILTSQLPKALGVDLDVVNPDVAGWGNPIARALWSIVHPGDWNVEAIAIAALTLTLMLGGRKLHRLFPGVLVAVLLVLGYSKLTSYDGPVVGDIPAGLPPFTFDLPWGEVGSLLVGGIVIALVGFAEPASIARTFANEEQQAWSSSREFVASGFANLVSGLTGAYPVGGSFSRSSVNRFAGARTRWSGGLTGVLVLAFLPFAGALADLPEAVLGAIVVGAVLSLIKPKRLLWLRTRSLWQAGLAWITFVATLLTPPQVQYAVMLGVVLTLALHVFRRFTLDAASDPDGTLRLNANGLLWMGTTGAVTASIVEAIEADDGVGRIVFDLGQSTAIDATIAEAIASGASASGDREFVVSNAPQGAELILENAGVAVAP